jgi:chromosome segregation ATPase
MAAVTAIVGGAVAAAGAIGGAISGAQAAKRAGRRAAREEASLEKELKAVERNRTPVINPYANVTDLSDKIQNLSGQLNNPYDNLGVATQAAKIQAEQSDIALANTLDNLAATGASAGGATALAQAALASKRGVAASIESQEAANEKLRAQGDAELQQQKLAEEQRVQTALYAEAGRMQEVDVAGQKFVYNEKEKRTMEQLDRLQGQVDAAAQEKQDAYNRKAEAISGGISGAAGGISNALLSDRKLKKNIKLIGKSKKGLNIYAFEYINKAFGNGVYQGVMADEMQQKAIIKHPNGYDMVNYSMIDVEFKKYN